MNIVSIIRLLVCVACAYAIFIQLLRIIWLYFPSFLKETLIYKVKEPAKTQMLFYYIMASLIMAYTIFVSLEKIF